MVRYWASHGSPAELATLPSGKVKIEPRGEDSISIGGKEERLKHYVIEGLVWGREALWFDAKNNLVAVVTFDAEFDHFEAVREGYESALGTFVGRAGADGMASLAEYAKGISGSRAEKLALVGGTLIDGNGGAPLADATVVIEKGRIVGGWPACADEGAEGRDGDRCARQVYSAGIVGHACALRAGGVGARLSGCRRDDRARCGQRV